MKKIKIKYTNKTDGLVCEYKNCKQLPEYIWGTKDELLTDKYKLRCSKHTKNENT